jgi:acetyl esterase/lipase
MGLRAPGADPKNLKYGRKHWQDIKFYPAAGNAAAPLVVVLGDGGIAGRTGWLRHRLNEAGYSVAFVHYRESVPTAGAALNAYATAIAYLVQEAVALGLDGTRIGIVGAGQGAEVAALLGTDPTVLQSVGVPFASLRRAILINGGHLDVPRALTEQPDFAGRFRRYYGRDPASHARHSPAAHLAPPNAPTFLMMADEEESEIAADTKDAFEAFLHAGIDTSLVVLPRERPAARQTLFMLEPEGAGKEVIPFLDAALKGASGLQQ